MKISTRVRIMPVVLALALGGCGEDSVSPSIKCGILGSTDVSVSGNVTASVNSCASYAVSTTSPTTAVTLFAGSVAGPTHLITLARQGTRPAVGAYTIGAGATQFAGTFTLDGGSGADRTFAFTSGTINITASSSGTLSGNLTSVNAAEVSTPANTITLSGTFSAKCVDTSDSDC